MGLKDLPPFLTVGPEFCLPQPGIYTLEGANGSGKSMLMRLLTGTLPDTFERKKLPNILVDGVTKSISNYQDAVRAGITAVFQDDEMIATMTIAEYLILAHSTASPARPAEYILSLVYSWFIGAWVDTVTPAMSPAVRSFVDRIKPRDVEWADQRALRERAEQLLRMHDVDTSILNEIPPRISGGGRAAARIVSAQLRPKTRVLLLDEAFNSVETNVWPRFVDTIKNWADENGTAVLAITHNQEELARWEPRIRFEICDGNLIINSRFDNGRRRRVVNPRRNIVPVYEVFGASAALRVQAYVSMWQHIQPVTRVVMVVEASFSRAEIITEFEKYLPLGTDVERVMITESELQSMRGSFAPLGSRLDDLRLDTGTAVVYAGGRNLRVMGSLASALSVHNAVAGVIVLPMDLGDAIDAVLSAVVRSSIQHPSKVDQKLTVGSFFLPDAYFLNLDAMGRQSPAELRVGLVKCLRLGLLFDRDLFQLCARALSTTAVTNGAALDIFHHAITVINDVTDVDGRSPGLARLMEFGSGLGACLASCGKGQLDEGEALLLGMMFELSLSGSTEIFGSLAGLYKNANFQLPRVIDDNAEFSAFYADCVERLGARGSSVPTIQVLKAQKLGEFNISSLRSALVNTKERRDRSLPKFANDIAIAAMHVVPLYHLNTVAFTVRESIRGSPGVNA